MEKVWKSTSIALGFSGEQLPEEGKIRRYSKVVEQPTIEQLQAFGKAIAALGVNEEVLDAEITTKQELNLA
ncbi:DUF1659 domain-containing protein [Lapidilactobacillus luobeiensis]|uniref:DUF1659 domain-containing protein n=1 Tax=Lapidilactobacillus luobeiensis TaxID=2950371 RepID=UPI0021C3C7FC|nr:hypothetical protein [Lapidilactobacillus luobeiensis]